MSEMRSQFLTRTFFDLYEDQSLFNTDLVSTLGSSFLSVNESNDLYMLIASKYGDSNIRYTNEKLFKLNLFKEIKVYYPKVLAFIRDQSRLRNADIADFQKSGQSIVNIGAHNTADVSTTSETGINQLDSQQVNMGSRGELSVLLDRLDAYRAGEEDKFLNNLNKLFIQIIVPMADLLYGTYPEEEGGNQL